MGIVIGVPYTLTPEQLQVIKDQERQAGLSDGYELGYADGQNLDKKLYLGNASAVPMDVFYLIAGVFTPAGITINPQRQAVIVVDAIPQYADVLVKPSANGVYRRALILLNGGAGSCQMSSPYDIDLETSNLYVSIVSRTYAATNGASAVVTDLYNG